MESVAFDSLKQVHANYVCLLPFAFMRSNEPKIYFNSKHQWWVERPEGVAACIAMAHHAGMKVMVKPQIWMHDHFTGDIQFRDEAQWKEFEENYTAYIFSLLHISDSMKADMFCLGTELDSFVKIRPQYWEHLIDTVRSIYSGKLTYAENWDCYHDFPFWQKLDYIGINAYFPLSDEATPTAESLKNGWKKYCEPMQELSVKTGRQILFTEFGYRSIDYCARQPWNAYDSSPKNYEAQRNAYESLFSTCWNESWFAGGFSWKWFDERTEPDVSFETDYTPQGKPAASVLRNWYAKSAN